MEGGRKNKRKMVGGERAEGGGGEGGRGTGGNKRRVREVGRREGDGLLHQPSS